MSISQALKKLRLERGWSQGEIYRTTGIERSAVSRLESGMAKDMSVRNAIKIARAFGISVEKFWEMCQAEGGGDSRDKSETSVTGREE